DRHHSRRHRRAPQPHHAVPAGRHAEPRSGAARRLPHLHRGVVLMRALKIAAKVIGWIALTTLLLVVATLITVVVAGRTEWGHRKLLAIALPEIQRQLAGHIRIGAIDGDLTHGLVVRDVEIDDIEHQPAVRVKALTVRYNLLG